MHQGIYDRLIELARAIPGQLTTYSDIAPLAGLSMSNDADRDQISALLDEIFLHEVMGGKKWDRTPDTSAVSRLKRSSFLTLAAAKITTEI